MTSQLAIDISIALVSDDRLIIEAVLGSVHTEDLIAEIIDKVLTESRTPDYAPDRQQEAESSEQEVAQANVFRHKLAVGFPKCLFCYKPLSQWRAGDECSGKVATVNF